MADDKKQSAKKKLPTAEKRMIQNKKRNLRNRAHKSKVKTALTSYHTSLQAGEKEAAQAKLNTIFSLMDKGVKKGIFKKAKANHTKSKMAARLAS